MDATTDGAMDAPVDATVDASDATTDRQLDVALDTPVDTSSDTEPDAPTGPCGNGELQLALNEQCDDGNLADGDGCSSACFYEPVGQDCGDLMATGLEKCDPPDGIPADGDGCNATCSLHAQVTTLARGVSGTAITTTGTTLYLYVANCGANVCGIASIEIGPCMASPSSAACAPNFIAGGAGSCACEDCGVRPSVLNDGSANTATFLGNSTGIATDGTRIWITEGTVLREVVIATGEVSTVAGAYDSCAAVDGIGSAGRLHQSAGAAYMNGLVYLLEQCEQVLRTFDPATGELRTIAGARNPSPLVTQSPPYTCPETCSPGRCNGGATTVVGGQPNAARFVSPRYTAVDFATDAVYVADTNGNALLRYTGGASPSVEVLVQGSSGVFPPNLYTDGSSGNTTLGRARGLGFDGTSLYWLEQRHGTVRQLDLRTNSSSTVVGTVGCIGPAVARDGQGANTTMEFSGPSCPPVTPLTPTLHGADVGSLAWHAAGDALIFIDGSDLRMIR